MIDRIARATRADALGAQASAPTRRGHDRIFDHMALDGLEDAYESGRAMGDFGEAAAIAIEIAA